MHGKSVNETDILLIEDWGTGSTFADSDEYDICLYTKSNRDFADFSTFLKIFIME